MAHVKTFKAEYGVSAEIKGSWHKFYVGIEIATDENDNLESIKKRAWNTCYQEIQNQIQALQQA